jgi:hypothetical protein
MPDPKRSKEREQKSAKVLVFPAAKTGSKLKFNERVRLASQQRTYARVAVDDVEPFVSHDTAGKLSDAHCRAACECLNVVRRIAAPSRWALLSNLGDRGVICCFSTDALPARVPVCKRLSVLQL